MKSKKSVFSRIPPKKTVKKYIPKARVRALGQVGGGKGGQTAG